MHLYAKSALGFLCRPLFSSNVPAVTFASTAVRIMEVRRSPALRQYHSWLTMPSSHACTPFTEECEGDNGALEFPLLQKLGQFLGQGGGEEPRQDQQAQGWQDMAMQQAKPW
jgi:hypothetical protein